MNDVIYVLVEEVNSKEISAYQKKIKEEYSTF